MSDFVIINGFDRSGTSAITRTIASHPDVEIIMQPFNSGTVRHKINQIYTPSIASKADYDFFNGLSQNIIHKSYIKSDWFYKFSSTFDYVPGKIHLVKTTINHFCQEWMNDYFPFINVWGIWRDPFDVINSSIRNGYNKKWYNGFVNQLATTVHETDLLRPLFVNKEKFIDNDVKELAYIIAVRSFYFFYYLPRGRVISYENFIKDPNRALSIFIDFFNLSDFDFTEIAQKDLNILGKKMSNDSINKIEFSKSDFDYINELFIPVNEVVCK
jgi:hypothetical protein